MGELLGSPHVAPSFFILFYFKSPVSSEKIKLYLIDHFYSFSISFQYSGDSCFMDGTYFDFFMIFKIGLVSDVLKTQGAQLILPVAVLHGAAFALGYWLSRVSFGESTSRTISIECGMQVLYVFFMIISLPTMLMTFKIFTMIICMNPPLTMHTLPPSSPLPKKILSVSR